MTSPEFAAALPALAAGVGAPPELLGEPARVIPLRPGPLTLGRDRGCDVVLDDPAVAPRHAVVTAHRAGYRVGDASGHPGTFVNGRPAADTPLADGDLVQVGPYLLRFADARLRWVQAAVPVAVAADRLSQAAGPARLLDGVSLALRPGEFVGLLGPSGCGKTTLLDALCGRRPASGGRVLFNGADFYARYADLRRLVGYVPQDDIVHPDLTPRRALRYAGLLRLPAGLPRAELDRRVDATLAALGLADRADVPVGRLSGGQRKRASVGVELIGRPAALFLDEPTAGLDPGAAARLVRTCRGLAREGRVVVCATHVVEDIGQFDRVAVLAAGRLAYLGPPAGMPGYFGAAGFPGAYERLADRPAAEWAARFARSGPGREAAEAAAAEARPRPFHRQAVPRPPAARGGARQWAVLTGRFGRTLAADPSLVRLALLQPLAVGGLAGLVFKDLRTVLFLLVVAALWLGCGLAAQQVVRERAVYRRERMVTLRVGPYVLSKFVPLAAVGAVQAALLLGAACGRDGAGWWPGYAGLALAAWNGTALGLLVSARAGNPDRASAAVPALMLPQVMLAGVLVALPDMNAPTRAAAGLAAARWANRVMEAGLLDGRRVDAALLADPAALWPLLNLYPGYDLRGAEGRAAFLRDHGGQVRGRAEAAAACGALAGLVASQLWAVGLVLRAQDPL